MAVAVVPDLNISPILRGALNPSIKPVLNIIWLLTRKFLYKKLFRWKNVQSLLKTDSREFITSIEITPPRGFDLTTTIEKSIKCREAGVDAINIPDGPRASSRISPIITAIEIQEKAGIEAVLHCCCRDKNLIGMQADLLGCASKNINNILFITGDPPKLGDYPFASAVFDVDAIGILQVCDKLNQGVDIGGKSIGAPTPICPGAGADPNAIDMERELRRLREKVAAGAKYIITQPVF